jgi:hypothetical protein
MIVYGIAPEGVSEGGNENRPNFLTDRPSQKQEQLLERKDAIAHREKIFWKIPGWQQAFHDVD